MDESNKKTQEAYRQCEKQHNEAMQFWSHLFPFPRPTRGKKKRKKEKEKERTP